ncbi:MAG: hypothetical protein RSB23_03330 [Alistipes sp.]
MKTSFNELKARNILSKEQMQNVKGGASCAAYVPIEYRSQALHNFAKVGGYAELARGNEESMILEGTSKDTALSTIAGIPGARWCCDSCGSASWL